MKFIHHVRIYTSRSALFKLLMLPLALIFLSGLILLRPFIIIQIFKVHDWRLGHLVSGTQLLTNETLLWNETHWRKKLIIYFFPTDISANDYFRSKLIANHFTIKKAWGTLLFILCRRFKFLIATVNAHEIDNLGLLISYPTEIVFTKNELKNGEKFLSHVGLELNSKFVCLAIRTQVGKTINSKHNKHLTRNSEIQTYTQAAEALAQLGYTVFRMGINAPNSLISDNPKVIDYATNGMRTEFLDIFLGAFCTFAVSGNTGWSQVPRIFRRPLMFVDAVPFVEVTQLVTPAIIYPKSIVENSTDRRLSFIELCEENLIMLSQVNQFRERGFRFESLSANDLVDAVTEMAARVENRFVPTEQQKVMQEKIQQELKSNPFIQPDPGRYKVRAEYASCFLSKYPTLFN